MIIRVAGYGDDAGDDDEDFLVDQLGEFRIRGKFLLKTVRISKVR